MWCGDSKWLIAMASKVLCRLCSGNAGDKNMTNLFTRKSLERGWALRISTLLDIPLKQDDHLSSHVCSKCMTRVVSLEKATADLAAFKRLARSAMQDSHNSLKRTKETTGDVGVSPNTLRQRPRAKLARRLPFTRMIIHIYLCTNKNCKQN